MGKKHGFGELELAILQYLKKRQKATVKEVYEALGKSNAYTTLMTVMNRMVIKKTLKRTLSGKAYVYEIESLTKEPSKGLFNSLKMRIFGGKTFEMISYLIDQADDLDEKDLEKLEELLKEHRKKP